MTLYSTQTTFSFADKVAAPSQIAVFDISGTTGTSTSLYVGVDYTVNWSAKTITLTTPLVLGHRLRIDVYEVGNGDQLVKSNTQSNPLRTGVSTGLCEIHLDCNYTGTLYSGSGVVISGTVPIDVTVVSTDSVDETLLCDAVDQFILNGPIKFTGVVFGNIIADTVYYVKTISHSSKRITLSATKVGGVAGPVYELISATGTMSITVQTGTADVYAPPMVSHNGTRLTMGVLLNISSIRGSNSGITCNTTTGLVVGTKIVFSNTIFGGILQPLVPYYIHSIIDDNEFTVSLTNGGALLSLTTASGGAIAITHDYAFSSVEQSTTAKLIFSRVYDHQTDFISYAVFGQTTPVQYGYTLPITEFIEIPSSITTATATASGTNLITVGSTSMLSLGDPVIFTGTTFGGIVAGTTYYVKTINSSLTLTISATPTGVAKTLSSATGSCVMTDVLYPIMNFVGGDNPTNAIVEKNGLRLTNTEYSISLMTNSITFTHAPLSTDRIAVTSYNLTDRQYLNTQYGLTGNTVSNIVYVNNEITPALNTVNIISTATGTNLITCDSTLNFVPDQTIIFQVADLGGDPYFANVWSLAHFNSSFTDQVPARSWSSVGSPTINSSNKQWGAGSLSVSSGNYVTVPNTGLASGTGAGTIFTIEMWVYAPLVTNYGVILSTSNNSTGSGFLFQIDSNGSIESKLYNGGGQYAFCATTAAGSIVQNTWTHLAWVKNGTATYLFIDGAVAASSTSSIAIAHAGPLQLGGPGWSANQASFLIDDVRITNGVARYTSAFPRPTAPFADFQAASASGLQVDGTVYYVKDITLPLSNKTFTVSATRGGSAVPLNTSTIPMVATVGGTPAVRVQTGSAHNLVDNSLVRIDGVVGSTQINNAVFYAKVINSVEFDLYTRAYSPIFSAPNAPLTDAFTYISGGYVWKDGIYTLLTTTASATSSTDNWITVANAFNLITGTEVIFTETGMIEGDTTLGGLVVGTTYYIADVDAAFSRFKISDTYQGPVKILPDDALAGVGVTQWEQKNVDRLWVTINGSRVPSSSLRINPDNNLSILSAVVPADEVIITNMIPTATPNELVYLQHITKENIASVYRANQQTRTWLIEQLSDTDDVIYVADVSKITNTVVQTVVSPAPIDGKITIFLEVDKRIITQVVVYNLTSGSYVDPANYYVNIEHISPMLNITSGVLTGQTLIITTIEGNLVYINGEQIRFSKVNAAANSLSGLQRGANGTGRQTLIPLYTEVYGVLSHNKLPEALYLNTFSNSDFPDQDGDVDGGPLQFFDTPAGKFLQRDIK